MNRRETLRSFLALGATAGPFAGFAQQPGRMRQVVLFAGSAQGKEWFVGGLRDLGWVEGKNIALQARTIEVDEEAMRAELRKLLERPVDVLVMASAPRIRAAMSVTSTIPIVGLDLESDPVASGFVNSLARPGGNVSGVWMDFPELAGKQLQLLGEAVPRLSRVGVAWDDRFSGPQLQHAQAAARASGVTLLPVVVHEPAEISGAYEQLLTQRAQALLVLTAPTIFRSLPRIADLAREHRLPSICLFSTYADAGGLLSYGPDFPSMWRQVAGYVNRIFKGAKVSDLPVERPSKFELAINLGTAKVLGIGIPQSFLLRADRVIE